MKPVDLRINGVRESVGFSTETVSLSFSFEPGEEAPDILVRVTDRASSEVVFEQHVPGGPVLDLPVEAALAPRTRYDVSLLDADGNVLAETFFETGKRDEPWVGQWIQSPLDPEGSPVFKKTVSLEKIPEQARMVLCGLGVYEVYINGNRVGTEYLAPGYHSYDFHLQASTLDVTDLLKEGENTILVFLGDGWYKGRLGFDGGYSNLYGDSCCLIAELYADGRLVAKTDESWTAKASPVVFSNIYDGEIFDARLLPELDSDDGWIPVKPGGAEKCGPLCDRKALPVVEKETFPVAEVIRTPKGETVLDFGQELTGFCRFETGAFLPEGMAVKFTSSEILQDDCFYHDNYRTARSEQIWISDGKEHTARVHHSFFGFRYVKVELLENIKIDEERIPIGQPLEGGATENSIRVLTGDPVEITDDLLAKMKVTAVHLRSDFDELASLSSGNETVNRLISNIFWGQKDNFLDVPTDCPQRDERLGWTGDAQIFSQTACLNMDMRAFYTKWLWDMRAEMSVTGGAGPNVVPRLKAGMVAECGSSPWADAAVVIPWNVYELYGSKTLLAETYPGMKAWVECLRTHEESLGGPHLVKDGFHFADWLSLDNPQPGPFGATDPLFVASAYYYQDALRVGIAASVLGNETDAEFYTALAEAILAAIQETYFEDGLCKIPTQTAAALSICFGLVEEECRTAQGDALAELVKANDGHLNTGFVGTPLLLPALSETGHGDLAVSLLLNEEYPGWLYCVNLGATTIWERWNSVEPDGHLNPEGMNSLNHYSYGSIAAWMHRYLAGLKPVEPGFTKVTIRPTPDSRLRTFRLRTATAAGTYESSWEVQPDGKVSFAVEVPAGCKAEFQYGEALMNLSGGRYEFTV